MAMSDAPSGAAASASVNRPMRESLPEARGFVNHDHFMRTPRLVAIARLDSSLAVAEVLWQGAIHPNYVEPYESTTFFCGVRTRRDFQGQPGS